MNICKRGCIINQTTLESRLISSYSSSKEILPYVNGWNTSGEKKRVQIFIKVKMRSKRPQKSEASDVFHMENAFFLTLSLFCSSRLLFSPNLILTALCENRFHNLQNKWKYRILGPRDKLRIRSNTTATVAVSSDHGQLLVEENYFFQK